MGFIFQPGTTRTATTHQVTTTLAHLDVATADRTTMTCAALEALTLGDAAGFDRLFTEDVNFRSPHVSVRTLSDLRRAVGYPESALTDLDIAVTPFSGDESAIVAEWWMEASLVAPVLFGDNVLIEPVPDRLQLVGAVFAEFAGDRISSFRCYFDDSEMLDGVAGGTDPLRLTARWFGSPDEDPRR